MATGRLPPKTGSADVLEALGVNLDMDEARQVHCLDHAGVTFLYARSHHSAMRHVAPIRARLGIRTLFNLLGPLSNPAGRNPPDPRRLFAGTGWNRWPKPSSPSASPEPGLSMAQMGSTSFSIAGETQICESPRRLNPPVHNPSGRCRAQIDAAIGS